VVCRHLLILILILSSSSYGYGADFIFESSLGLSTGSMGDGVDIPSRTVGQSSLGLLLGAKWSKFAYLIGAGYSMLGQTTPPEQVSEQNLSGTSQSIALEVKYLIKSWALGLQLRPFTLFNAKLPSLAGEQISYSSSSGFSFTVSKHIKKSFGVVASYALDSYSKSEAITLDHNIKNAQIGLGVIYIFNWEKSK